MVKCGRVCGMSLFHTGVSKHLKLPEFDQSQQQASVQVRMAERGKEGGGGGQGREGGEEETRGRREGERGNWVGKWDTYHLLNFLYLPPSFPSSLPLPFPPSLFPPTLLPLLSPSPPLLLLPFPLPSPPSPFSPTHLHKTHCCTLSSPPPFHCKHLVARQHS